LAVTEALGDNAPVRLLLALIFVSCSAHAEGWKPADYQMLGVATALLVIDWGQTRNLAREETVTYATPACSDPNTRNHPLAGSCPPQRQRVHTESNPLLPKHPNVGEVDKYFAVAMLGTLGLSYALPTNYRRYFLGAVIVLEAATVLRNHHIGLRVDF
jgi:hypothetical protein